MRRIARRVAGEPRGSPAPSEPDVKLSLHPAQAFANASGETRSAAVSSHTHESDGGSLRAATPGCHTCPRRRDSANADDAGATTPIPLRAVVAHTPYTGPLGPSINKRSVLVPQAS